MHLQPAIIESILISATRTASHAHQRNLVGQCYQVDGQWDNRCWKVGIKFYAFFSAVKWWFMQHVAKWRFFQHGPYQPGSPSLINTINVEKKNKFGPGILSQMSNVQIKTILKSITFWYKWWKVQLFDNHFNDEKNILFDSVFGKDK